MVKSVEGVGPADAPARIGGRSVGLLVAIATILAACASSHPAPIVHRTPTTRPAAAPATVPPVATLPTPAPAPGAADSAPLVIETTPVPSSRVESRPLPGPGGTIAAPAPLQSSNMLKTEPMATKQPYSDSLFEELKSAAPPAGATPGPVAIAPPTAPAPAAAPTPPPAPAAAAPAAGAASAADFVWPATGQVVQGFAEPRNMGITIAGKPGDPIVAAADGRVIFSGPGPRGYGNLVILKHANETLSVYGHNRTLLVKEGQSVKRGQRIAELGSSGADSPQLRFEIRKDGKPVDPRKYLPAR
jgi:lipoprotein NlpD